MRWNGLAATIVLAAVITFAPTASAQFNIFGIGNSTLIPPALAKQLDRPVTPQFIAALTRASRAGLAYTGKPAASSIKAIAGPALGTAGKPGVLYIGADFCPYCASERWGLMLTLLRFGKLEGVRYMVSSSSDVFANTPTVTFQHARLASPYLTFQAVETADRLQRPLMTPSKQQLQILTHFDMPPYVEVAESIPFVYVDGKYMLSDLLLAPKSLDGKDWQQIAGEMANPKSALFAQVMPRVNLLTAAICRVNGDQPASVCRAPGVAAAQRVLSTVPAASH